MCAGLFPEIISVALSSRNLRRQLVRQYIIEQHNTRNTQRGAKRRMPHYYNLRYCTAHHNKLFVISLAIESPSPPSRYPLDNPSPTHIKWRWADFISDDKSHKYTYAFSGESSGHGGNVFNTQDKTDVNANYYWSIIMLNIVRLWTHLSSWFAPI